MAAPMIGFGDLATFLALSAGRARAGMVPQMQHVMDGAAQEAKDFIGHELAEWKPLAPSTIAEKERLGFTGQVSATDPLLRTGDMRDSIEAMSEATSAGAEA